MEFALTRKDREILFELSLNARISLTELAKRTRLSKQTVSYRLTTLENQKVILGYYAITNVYMLGMTHYRVFLKYQNMLPEKEKELMDFLKKNQKINWLAYLDGRLDLVFLVWGRNIREFETVYDDITHRFGAYIQERTFSIATKIEYLKYSFLTDKNSESTIIFGDCFSDCKLDELERKVLNHLNKNGRETLVELAKKTGSSPKVVKTKIDKLVKNGIIVGFNVKIDHHKLGYTHRKVFLDLNDNSKEKIGKLSAYLRNQKSVIYLVKPIGSYDFEFELMTSSNEEFHKMVKDLRTEFAENIKSHDSIIIFSEPKSGQMVNF